MGIWIAKLFASRKAPRVALLAALLSTAFGSAAAETSGADPTSIAGAITLLERTGIALGLLIGLLTMIWLSGQGVARWARPWLESIARQHIGLVQDLRAGLAALPDHRRRLEQLADGTRVELEDLRRRIDAPCPHPQCPRFRTGEPPRDATT